MVLWMSLNKAVEERDMPPTFAMLDKEVVNVCFAIKRFYFFRKFKAFG